MRLGYKIIIMSYKLSGDFHIILSYRSSHASNLFLKVVIFCHTFWYIVNLELCSFIGMKLVGIIAPPKILLANKLFLLKTTFVKFTKKKKIIFINYKNQYAYINYFQL